MTCTNDSPLDEALAEAVRRLADSLKPERIYLFGSQARGDANADSDYDLVVIVPGAGLADRYLSEEANRVLWEVPIAADVLVWTQEAFERQVPVAASLPATVVREGRLLYAT